VRPIPCFPSSDCPPNPSGIRHTGRRLAASPVVACGTFTVQSPRQGREAGLRLESDRRPQVRRSGVLWIRNRVLAREPGEGGNEKRPVGGRHAWSCGNVRAVFTSRCPTGTPGSCLPMTVCGGGVLRAWWRAGSVPISVAYNPMICGLAGASVAISAGALGGLVCPRNELKCSAPVAALLAVEFGEILLRPCLEHGALVRMLGRSLALLQPVDDSEVNRGWPAQHSVRPRRIFPRGVVEETGERLGCGGEWHKKQRAVAAEVRGSQCHGPSGRSPFKESRCERL
jgi:hypothetical protein